MKRVFPWILAVVATIAFAASFSELQRMRMRFGEVTRHHFRDHQEVRQFIIKTTLIGLDQPIVILGDSITEMAKLPDAIDGHPVVNAGVGGASIGDFISLAPNLLDGVKPSLCVIALGANDVGSTAAETNYAALLSRLKAICPKLLAYAATRLGGSDLINGQIKAAAEANAVPFVEPPVPPGATLPDHIHLNAAGRQAWTAGLVAAITALRS
jgi:lysophospholipase L1-like esterase